MHKRSFFPSIEGEARILLLINSFSSPSKSLEGRTKLAKLDFFLRYPLYFERALKIRSTQKRIPLKDLDLVVVRREHNNIENRMIRYRYGPWDPAYFGILGKLIGKGLVVPLPVSRGIGYKTTKTGKEVALAISKGNYWSDIATWTKLLRKHFDISGNSLKNFIYSNFPEVTAAKWGEEL